MIDAPREMHGLAPNLGQLPHSDEGTQDPLIKDPHASFPTYQQAPATCPSPYPTRNRSTLPVEHTSDTWTPGSPARAAHPAPLQTMVRLRRRKNALTDLTPAGQAHARRMTQHAHIKEKIMNLEAPLDRTWYKVPPGPFPRQVSDERNCLHIQRAAGNLLTELRHRPIMPQYILFSSKFSPDNDFSHVPRQFSPQQPTCNWCPQVNR